MGENHHFLGILYLRTNHIPHVLFYVGKPAIYKMNLVHRYIFVWAKSVNRGCNEYQSFIMASKTFITVFDTAHVPCSMGKKNDTQNEKKYVVLSSIVYTHTRVKHRLNEYTQTCHRTNEQLKLT